MTTQEYTEWSYTLYELIWENFELLTEEYWFYYDWYSDLYYNFTANKYEQTTNLQHSA